MKPRALELRCEVDSIVVHTQAMKRVGLGGLGCWLSLVLYCQAEEIPGVLGHDDIIEAWSTMLVAELDTTAELAAMFLELDPGVLRAQMQGAPMQAELVRGLLGAGLLRWLPDRSGYVLYNPDGTPWVDQRASVRDERPTPSRLRRISRRHSGRRGRYRSRRVHLAPSPGAPAQHRSSSEVSP